MILHKHLWRIRRGCSRREGSEAHKRGDGLGTQVCSGTRWLLRIAFRATVSGTHSEKRPPIFPETALVGLLLALLKKLRGGNPETLITLLADAFQIVNILTCIIVNNVNSIDIDTKICDTPHMSNHKKGGDVQTETGRETVRLSFDLSPELRKRIRLAAVNRDMTLTEFLTAIVEEGLSRPEAGDEARKGETCSR